MWLRPGCEECGWAGADVSCDACGVKLCCECVNILNCAITDAKGNLYLHLCDNDADKIEVEDEVKVYTGPYLIVDNTRKPAPSGEVKDDG